MQKAFLIILLSSLCILFGNINTWAANYYFSKARNVDGYYYLDIYELNLETGSTKIIIPAENKIRHLSILDDQSKIFFICNWKLCAFDTEESKVDTLSFLGSIETIENDHYVPYTNELYLEIIKPDAPIDTVYGGLKSSYIALDKYTYHFNGQIKDFYGFKSILSKNGQIRYRLVDTEEGIYFYGYKIQESEMESGIEFPILGYDNLNLNHPPVYYNSSNGYALVRYVSNDSAHFVICEPENKTSVCDLALLWKSCPYFDAYLSPNGDIVLDNVGNIYIYDGQTAELKQRTKFTPPANNNDDPVVLFLNDKLYYLPEDPAESDATSFDNIQSTDPNIVQSKAELLSAMLNDLDECCTEGWIDNQGICNSLRQKLENAMKHFDEDQIKQALNVLNAFKNEIDAQKGKHITDWAWRILSLNVDQIIRIYK